MKQFLLLTSLLISTTTFSKTYISCSGRVGENYATTTCFTVDNLKQGRELCHDWADAEDLEFLMLSSAKSGPKCHQKLMHKRIYLESEGFTYVDFSGGTYHTSLILRPNSN